MLVKDSDNIWVLNNEIKVL